MCACMCVYVKWVCMCVCVYALCVYVYMCVDVYMCVAVYVCMGAQKITLMTPLESTRPYPV